MRQELLDIEDTVKSIATQVIEGGHEHRPLAIVASPDGVSIVSFGSVPKDAFKNILLDILHKEHAYGYVFVDEAWMTNVAANRIINEGISISELPPDDRDEVICIIAVENKCGCRFSISKILYNRDNTRTLDKFKTIEPGISEGRLVVPSW